MRRSAVEPPRRDPRGRPIVVLAKEEYGLRAPEALQEARFVPFAAATRMSGIDLAEGSREICKGAAAAVMKWVRDNGGHLTEDVDPARGPRHVITDPRSATAGRLSA